MAIGETARLIASLELQDKFSGTTRKAERSLGGLERRMGTATRATRGLGVAGVAVGTALGSIGSRLVEAGVRSLVGQFQQGIDAIHELENVTVATATVLQSTGGVAGVTAEQVRSLAEKFENLNATMDDKVIQSAENMLLTFTNVRGKAFEPALAAILDLNEAMGGGPEGLQATAIQVGKALQDPVRGATALRKVGVALTKEQQAQIKTLVAQNDLYGAQQVILAELATEYGGRFAAAGKTAEGQTARIGDKIEDLQKRLAGPLIPALDRVRAKLLVLLDSPAVLAGADRLGAAIAGLLSEENLTRGVSLIERAIDTLSGADFGGVTGTLGQIAETIGNLPWQAIGDAARLLGTGSKALLDAFTSLPPWVQTAVLTGWGLNKLTGGVLGGIVGQLASGLIRGVLGINAGVVNVNAATVTGVGGAPVAGAKGGGLIGGIAKFVLGPAAAVIIGAEIAAVVNEHTIAPAREFEAKEFEAVVASKDLSQIINGLDAIRAEQNTDDLLAQTALIASNIPFIGDALGHVGPALEDQKNTLLAQLKEMGLTEEEARALLARAATAQKDTVTELRATKNELIGTKAGIAEQTNATVRAQQAALVSSERLRSESAALRQSQAASAAGVVAASQRTAAAVNEARSIIGRGFSESVAASRQTVAQTASVAARVAEARGAIGRGFSELGGVVRASRANLRVTVNVNSSLAISDTLRRITSARVATGTISEF